MSDAESKLRRNFYETIFSHSTLFHREKSFFIKRDDFWFSMRFYSLFFLLKLCFNGKTGELSDIFDIRGDNPPILGI